MSEIDRLLSIMARLRDPVEGCPWDLEQTFATIVPHTIEEAYEVAQAIADQDLDALKDELGDLLFQIVFFAQMAREAGGFGFEDVVRAIADKMQRRHPHVFGDATIDSAAAQTRHWERIKADERAGKAGHGSVLDGIAAALPGLSRAVKLQKRAAQIGFDWIEVRDILDKLDEESRELRAELDQGAPISRVADEIGDILFVCANLARRAGVDAETAMRAANAKFERRFRRLEELLAASGHKPGEMSLDQLEGLWTQAKSEEPGR